MSAREAWLTQSNRPSMAPEEQAGKWVAWNRDLTRVLASADEASAAFDAAIGQGHPEDQIVLQRVPQAGTIFIGGL